MAGISHCTVCRRGLRAVALFCPGCGFACCSWSCYLRHQPKCSAGAQQRFHSPDDKETRGSPGRLLALSGIYCAPQGGVAAYPRWRK